MAIPSVRRSTGLEDRMFLSRRSSMTDEKSEISVVVIINMITANSTLIISMWLLSDTTKRISISPSNR
ncbi:hypothetical protein D3C85_1738640 [compost metagenome]